VAERLALLDDPELGRALEEVGRRLHAPPEPGPAFAVAVRQRIEASWAPSTVGPRRRVRAVAGPGVVARLVDHLPGARSARRTVVIALAAVLLLAVAATATTLGVRGIRIIFGPAPSPSASVTGSPVQTSPPPLGGNLVLGDQVSLAEARSRAGFRVVVPTLAGLPEPEIWFDPDLAGGQVTFVYPPTTTLPEVGTSGVGLLVTQFQGRAERQFLDKMIMGTGTRLQSVEVGGQPGFWLAGTPHELVYLDQFGLVIQSTLRLAGNTLMWQRGDLTLRVEGGTSLPKTFALNVARSVR
jgi:hypothetical protein